MEDAPASPSPGRDAPRDFLGILKELGPGLIIAGSVVGSGELIATTVAGAEAGFWLLWVILFGCVIKVFVQLEVGKFTVVSEQPRWKTCRPWADGNRAGCTGSRGWRC